MKIYDFKLAPNPRRVRIFIAEKGVEVTYVQVDLFAGHQHRAEFLEKNPLGGLPVLEFDDGTYLAESVAICRYFEAMYPEPPLLGINPKDAAFVEMWNRRMEFDVSVGPYIFQREPTFVSNCLANSRGSASPPQSTFS